jgi:hypothetical protein
MNCECCGYHFRIGETPNWQNEVFPDTALCGECDYQFSAGNRKMLIKGANVDGEQLYWSNEDGWVDRLSATVFDADEVVGRLKLVEQSGLEFFALEK